MANYARSGYSEAMTTSTLTRQSTGWTADASTFGARLALIRQRMGWGNIAKAAKACDIAVDSWRNWEVDGREPHRMTTIAKQIAGATGCDYLWLVHGPDRGEGGTEFKGRYNPLAERPITRRAHVKSSAERPTQRRAKPLRSPNRSEPIAA